MSKIATDNDGPFDASQSAYNRSPLDNHELLSGQYWAELRVFLAVAKVRSFNRAAEMLGISQPTVSKGVRRLQDVLGAQLILISARGVQLTERGEELAKLLTKLDRTLFSIASDFAQESGESTGRVEITITEGLGALFMAPLANLFSDQYPGIHLSIKNPISVVDYEKNQTDLMIGFAPITSDGLTFRPLGNLHFMPIAPKGYVERYGLPTRSNLEDHYFINSDLYSAQNGFWDRWTDLTRRGTVRHSCDSSFSYAAMVKAGAGIGLLGSFTSLEPHSVPLDLDTVIPVRLFLVANKERLAAKPVRIVHDWMSEIFGSENPWFSETLNLGQHDGKFDKGYKALFNLV